MLSVPIKRMPDGALSLHATTVSYADKALVIAGPSGAGKSSLALRMISLGAALITDDVTQLSMNPNGVYAHAPSSAQPLIEVRGLGLLNAPIVTGERLHTILDLGQDEVDRLPSRRHITIFDRDVTVLHRPATPNVAEAMIHYLKYGRSD